MANPQAPPEASAPGPGPGAPLGAPSESLLRPRYEGCNICTWIGFKHVSYLLEEAVLDHFRAAGLGPGGLYERHGLCLEIVEIDARILTALHADDVVHALVAPAEGGDGELETRVTLTARRPDGPVKAVTATVRVLL